jgi:hypothetical protein
MGVIFSQKTVNSKSPGTIILSGESIQGKGFLVPVQGEPVFGNFCNTGFSKIKLRMLQFYLPLFRSTNLQI